MNENLLKVSSSPHIRSRATTSGLMLNVILALLPTSVAGIYFFGLRAALILIFSVCCAVFFEGIWCVLAKKEMTLSDMSAVVTGLILGLNVSSATPLFTLVVGNAVAIIIAKQLYGGLGHNFINPAMAGRAVMLICWPVAMNIFPEPFGGVDAVTSATVLSGGEAVPVLDMFLGNMQGCIGEVSALALIVGGVYLIITKTIKPYIPVTYILTVFIMTYLAGGDGTAAILSGGLMLGAFFMATDYVTSPLTWKGQVIMGLGLGIITAVIRIWGGYPEGVTFAILLMNAATPLIDRITAPKRYGRERKNA